MPGDVSLALDRIVALLDRQRDGIRRGDFAALGLLTEEMAMLLVGVEPGVTHDDATGLERLKLRAGENQRLLEASRRGVQAARTRVASIFDAGTRLNSYDSSGRALTVSLGSKTVERRA